MVFAVLLMNDRFPRDLVAYEPALRERWVALKSFQDLQ